MAKKFICTNCGFIGHPKKVTKGSFFVEVLLWFFFIVPGIVYTIWRLTTKYEACPSCGASNMIPLDSPMGKKLAAEIQSSSTSTSKA